MGRSHFEGCTEWSCIYHGAYNRAAENDPCNDREHGAELALIVSTHEVQCVICGTSYGLIERGN